MKYALAAALLVFTHAALAHGEVAASHDDLLLAWSFDPAVIIPLLLAVAFYLPGVHALWQRAGPGHGISRTSVACYLTGLFVIVMALLSPLDALASALFSAHMVQHLLLILVAPPLLVAGAPDIALLWALPVKWRRGWGKFTQRFARSLQGERGAGLPLSIVLIATGVLWLWHVPRFYELALQNAFVHWMEHAAFVVTALLFWTSIIRLRPHDHSSNGLRILYVFGMAIQGSLLGALITFASYPLYASHVETSQAWGIPALLDQQIAGLIMWVPPAALYISVSSYLFVRWLGRAASRRTTPAGIHNGGSSP